MAISILSGCSIANLINTDIKQMKLAVNLFLYNIIVEHVCCVSDLTFGSMYRF